MEEVMDGVMEAVMEAVMDGVMEEVMDGVIDAMAGLPTGTMALCCSLVLPILGVYNELELIPNV